MSILFLVLPLIIKVKLSEAIECYSYCSGNNAECTDASQEVGNRLNCSTDEICMAEKFSNIETYKCINAEEVKKCEKHNQVKTACFTCNIDLCNTAEKLQEIAASRTQCYIYCTEPDCVATSTFPKEPNTGPCGLETKHCVGMKMRDGDYYSCGNKDLEDKCKQFNKIDAVCLFCEGNLCNKPESVAELEKSRLHCYHYCTGDMCTKKFGKPWDEGHTQVCSSTAIGCVGIKKGKKKHLFRCVENKNTSQKICRDKTSCVFCKTNLCNSPKSVTIKHRCYSFCFHPYEDMKTCENPDSRVANKEICPEGKRAGCMIIKQGSSEVYACASEKDREKCSEMNERGEGVCFFCEDSMCNTQGAINAFSQKYLPLGVSLCYSVDGRNSQSKVSVTSCKFPNKNIYKCLSVIEKQADGSFVLSKNCTADWTTKMRSKCDSNVKNGKNLCYTCNQDLCNKNNFSVVDLGQKIIFDGGIQFINFPRLWYLCLGFLPSILNSLYN